MYFPNFISTAQQAMAVSEQINSRLKTLSNTGAPQEEFLFSCINEFLQDPKRDLMLTARRYFENDNDIVERKRYYIDRLGIKQEAVNLSNSRLSHPIVKKLTNQKISYLLSKPFSIQCEDDVLLEEVTAKLGKHFKKLLKTLGKNAIIDGISWLQVYYDNMGNLGFKRIPADEVIPFWADADHTVLDGLIRFYVMTQYLAHGETKEITKVEYYTLEGVWYYVIDEDGLQPDPEMGEQNWRGHFTIDTQVTTRNDDTGEEEVSVDEEGNPLYQTVQSAWDRLPFVAFKYNAEEISLLKWIKPLIDDYDINTSDTSNVLQDVPNSIKIVKNYDGTNKEEFTQNLQTYRTAFIAGDGDITNLETKLDVDAVEKHLARLRKDIYEAGSGVDTQEADLGTASGVALKFRYADLDMDCENLANEFTSALEDLIWFIKVDLASKTGQDYLEADIDITFNTDIRINETEVIDNLVKSVGILSDETLIANHPWVGDADEELDRVTKQKDEAMKQQQELLAQEYGSEPGDKKDEEKEDEE